ncbi:hypothetical protein OBBRIDRAFT_839875 [Obba rivulosa]|uniref:DUF6533 domain-containing protein n=1 Tax=Obba rivulosa TaxID=1052685 RepID=A0A8E2AS46_9APHY|nr:hypothetical protein OBBRIDRAFT_839875 [Obba rivulosa]
MPTYTLNVSFLQGVQANRYSALAGFVVLYYDYCLTFHDEVERFWKGFAFSWGSALFFINRYFSLLGPIPAIVEYFGSPSAAWSVTSSKDVTEDVIPSLQNWPICALYLTDQQANHSAIAWGCMMAFDTLVFILTVNKTISSHNTWKGSLFHVMLRDGSIYYGIMALTNVANIITFLVVAPSAKGLYTITANVTASIIISRLMLNLRTQVRQMSPPVLPISLGIAVETDSQTICSA